MKDYAATSKVLKDRTPKSARGLTLVELVVAMAVLAILLGIGAPSFRDFVANTQQTGAYNSFAKALRLARSEAIKRSSPVSVCARATNTSCGDEWKNGVLVFLDPDSGTPDSIDDDDDVLMVAVLDNQLLEIEANATVRPDGMATQSGLRFNARGRANWTLGTVVFCDERSEESARAMIVSGSGLFRRSFTTPSSTDIEVDALGDPVEC